ncbi:MAG: type I-MYXAN CRISPR-associated endonuclease Cas1 [Candidatus Tectomicrobia bacterium]|uniref:CRISPR-associated endonuclease Cas1 n=1 Tax=Tectimicrobiota bacterium TaxID=2528274 RepID=A0A938B370_UNCTE|nr:type I-MYXAN CRISPR-associated endonuclease Cas1 [Candidatus Tectomicrobia bacterium]
MTDSATPVIPSQIEDTEPLRVMSLHALAYCERLFYLEEVEEIRLADERVFAGRRLHAEIEREEDDAESLTLTLESARWELRGKVDCLRRRDGQLIPYEHKRGRAARTQNGTPEAWPSDRVQLTAYTVLLEEHSGRAIPEGRLRYHADNVTVRVPIDEDARTALARSITRARELQASVERPPVTTNERLCVRCSLAPVCLPEEARLPQQPEHQTLRLFPADDERRVLHILTQGARVGRKGDRLEVSAKDEAPSAYPVHEIGQVVLHGFSQITTQALRLCAEQEVGVHWVTTGGRYMGSWASGAGPVQRRIRQYKALTDHDTCLHLARRLTEARVRGQLSVLLRTARETHRVTEGVTTAISTIRKLLRPMARAESLHSLRGYEGSIAAQYFGALPDLISPEVGPLLKPDGRNRRPPRDRCNALLSFGYALLHKDILNAILVVGLDPALGFYHQPRSQAHPLALDLLELFRVPLVDIPVLASINRRQWDIHEDFQIAGQQVWLSETGKKKFIQIYERRKADQWKHPVIGHSLSYARLIELEVRLLEKEWMGEGGLFARMRLR